MSFELSKSDLDYQIAILPQKSLKLHEAVVDDHVMELLDAIDRQGMIRDPVIVDRETDVVLDGMHRVTAIRRLGLRGVPVCQVDYRATAIEIGGWLRVFDDGAVENIKSAIRSHGIRCNPAESITREWPSLPLLLGPDTSIELDREGEAPKRVLDRTMTVVDALSANGIDSRLQPDNTLDRIDTEVTLVLPAPDKSAVVTAAEKGDPFPPNTTRHVIPTRPVAVNSPLELLDINPEDGTRRLDRRLQDRSIDRLPPGSEYAGRTYEEALLVFD